LKKAEDKNVECEKVIADLRSQLENAKNSIKKNQEQIDAQKDQISVLQKELFNKDQEIRDLNKKIDELNGLKSKLEDSNKGLKELNDNLSKDLKNALDDKRNAEDKLVHAETDLAAAKNSYANLQADYKSFKDISNASLKDKNADVHASYAAQIARLEEIAALKTKEAEASSAELNLTKGKLKNAEKTIKETVSLIFLFLSYLSFLNNILLYSLETN